MKRAIIVLSMLGVVLAGLLYATDHLPMAASRDADGRTDVRAAAPVPAVSVIKPKRRDLHATVLVTGTLVPRTEVLIAPEVEGLRVVEIHADEGDQVKAGQVLARLDRSTLEAQLAQSRANIVRAKAAIAQARSAIALADAADSEAQRALERAAPLVKKKIISQSVFDQREAAALSTQARRRAAVDGLKVAEAEHASLLAQQRELRWRLSKTEMVAPVGGLITHRSARIGAVATGNVAANPLFRLTKGGRIELEATVPEQKLVSLRANQPAIVEAAGIGSITGSVRLVSPQIDRATRLGRVRIALGSHAQLRVGGFARGNVITKTARGLTVPTSALLFTDAGAFVQVVGNDRVETRKISTGLMTAGLVEVKAGLEENDLVVARAGTFLRDGDPVRPVKGSSKTRVSAVKR